jgi:hypothetical protein
MHCERRVWLSAYGRVAARDKFAGEKGVAVTRDEMQQGTPAIIGAFVEYRTPLGLTDRGLTPRARIDRLVRLSHQGKTVYAPIEIKHRAKPVDADWVQLDCYVWLLSLVQGIMPPAELWTEHGDPWYAPAPTNAKTCSPWRVGGGGWSRTAPRTPSRAAFAALQRGMWAICGK